MEQIGKIRFCHRDYLCGGHFGSKFSGKFEDTLDVAIERLKKEKYTVEAYSLWISQASAHKNIFRYFNTEETHNQM